ncbi:heat stress transcription factor A-4b-like [Zingiber officinale]|uniref:heat stress transcription factor A-4b-like n=1 Tax=Zingiber officinale TaxID=94328 RepID=UPI001C4C6C2F|nr:heat stress transcription factor A-4b-like [Zingiber officinale]
METEGSGGGSRGGSSSQPPPFLDKTYDMVDDPATNSVVSWSASNASFVVWNAPDFSRILLPRYFKHNNFSSFVRQLNTYGFRKVDPDQWEFANEDFVRGQRHLLKNIHRRKPIHSHSLAATHLNSSIDKQELEEEIERLKLDKRRLWSEIQRHTQKQCELEWQMQALEERLQVLGHRQKGLVSFLTRAIQNPAGFLSNFVQHLEEFHTKKKRKLPRIDYSNDDDIYGEEQPVQAFDMESFEKMESSLNSLENFFRGVSQASGDDIPYDNMIISETIASSVPRLLASSPEIQESTSFVETPSVPAIEKEVDSGSKFSEIDVNLEPNSTEVDSSRDVGTTTTSAVPAGANDVFWEQFLTEIPGSFNTKEAQSTRRDSEDNQGNVIDRKSVDNFSPDMKKNLTSAEKT